MRDDSQYNYRPVANTSAGTTDLNLISRTFTYAELAMVLSKIQQCRVSTAMLFVTKEKKRKDPALIEESPNCFRVLSPHKITERLVGEMPLEM